MATVLSFLHRAVISKATQLRVYKGVQYFIISYLERLASVSTLYLIGSDPHSIATNKHDRSNAVLQTISADGT